jgi:hypothetical protein
MSSPEVVSSLVHRTATQKTAPMPGVRTEASPPAPATERDRAIDISRMAAAFLIVMFHAAESYSLSGGEPVFGRPLWSIVGDISLWGRVPFFFFLSGCFAARSLQKRPDAAGALVRKRVTALLPPYLFWNLVSFSMIWIAVRQGFGGPHAEKPSWGGALAQLTGIGSAPANGPLWFVRDLILCSCLAPLFKRVGVWLLIPCVALVTFPEIPEAWISKGCLRPSSLGYFGIGMLLNLVPRGTIKMLFPKPGVGALLCIGLGIARTVLGMPKPALSGVACGALGILLVGHFVDESLPKLAAWLGRHANASFLIFAANVPFLAVARQVYPHLPGSIPRMAYYGVLGVIFIFLAIAAHDLIKRYAPKLLLVVSGGR